MMARYLADSLNVDRSLDDDFKEIGPENQTIDLIRDLVKSFRVFPKNGKWRVFLLDECSRMSGKVQGILSHAIDHLPPHIVLVFTTEGQSKLSQSFCDKCRSIPFIVDKNQVRDFARQEWERRMPGSAIPEQLLVAGSRPNSTPSYRTAVRDIEDAIEMADRPDASMADFRQWIVHDGSNICWNVGPEKSDEARGCLYALRCERPGVEYFLARTAETDKRGVSVPEDACPAN